MHITSTITMCHAMQMSIIEYGSRTMGRLVKVFAAVSSDIVEDTVGYHYKMDDVWL